MIPDDSTYGGSDNLWSAIGDISRDREWLGTRKAIDSDGQLAETSAMLRLKRGCRR